MKLYKYLLPALKRFDHETAHRTALYAMKLLSIKTPKPPKHEALQQDIWGYKFCSPIGLAAGFDKNALAINGHFHLGFGFVEVGTITPEPQEGNPKPRIFMNEEHDAIINRMGFPNDGLEVCSQRIGSFRLAHNNHWGVLGVNIGVNANKSNAAQDLKTGVAHIGGMADYIVLNVSSPNTKGLRAHLHPENMDSILAAVMEEREKIYERLPAVVVKVSPDMGDEDIAPLCDVLRKYKVNGVLVSNTTVARPADLPAGFAKEQGGLSGRPLEEKSTRLISKFYKELEGKITIIGCGGIYDAETAYRKIKAGAQLVQLYSALVTEGPQVVREIETGLARLLQADGHKNISEAVGAAHKTG